MANSPAPTRLVALSAALALCSAACSHASDFMWVDAVPKSMWTGVPTTEIAPGDVIGVRVFGNDATSLERVRVRDDGKISLPLLNDVEVAGSEPAELARRLEVKLKAFVNAPAITVVIHERHPLRVSVVGKVTRPGVYDLDRGAGVVHALAAAGGLTPFADENAIYVLRSRYWADGDPSSARIRFRYRDVTSGRVPAATFPLRAGDVVVVE